MEGTAAVMPQLDGVTQRGADFPAPWIPAALVGVAQRHSPPGRALSGDCLRPARVRLDTDAPADGYNARTLIEDIVLLMGELDIPRARFLTHDWGSVVAQLLAMERPDLVEALVVTGTPDVHIRPNAGLLGLFPKLRHAFALAAPLIGPRLQGNEKFTRHLFTAFEPADGVPELDMELYGVGMAQPERERAGSALYRGTILPAFMAIIFGAYAKRDFTVPTLAPHRCQGAVRDSSGDGPPARARGQRDHGDPSRRGPLPRRPPP